MSAAEIIDRIKTLSPAERSEVAAFLQHDDGNSGADSGIRYADPDSARDVSTRIFKDYPELFRKLAE